MSNKKPKCPDCSTPLVVESRGHDFIAICPGRKTDTAEWNVGCYAEFGDTRAKAVAALMAKAEGSI